MKSCCSLGVPVEFYYALCAGSTLEEHITAAVDALWNAIQRPGERAWNPHSRAMVRAEFRDRLLVATEGDLVPVDHIKPVGDGSCHLYEIRWVDIPIAILDENRQISAHANIHVRLIHTEPDTMKFSAIALHAHEKILDGVNTRPLQDAEIKVAEDIFDKGYEHLWAISPR